MLYECGSCSAIITPYIRVRISLEPFIPTLNIALPLTRPELQRSQGVELGLRFWVTERQNTRWHFFPFTKYYFRCFLDWGLSKSQLKYPHMMRCFGWHNARLLSLFGGLLKLWTIHLCLTSGHFTQTYGDMSPALWAAAVFNQRWKVRCVGRKGGHCLGLT